MIVKVHPHRTKVNAGDPACVSVTPKGGKAYYVGYVALSNARFVIHQSGVERARKEQRRNVHAWCVGELDWEWLKPFAGYDFADLGCEQVTYHYNIGRFVTLTGEDVTDETFEGAICNGRDFWVHRS